MAVGLVPTDGDGGRATRSVIVIFFLLGFIAGIWLTVAVGQHMVYFYLQRAAAVRDQPVVDLGQKEHRSGIHLVHGTPPSIPTPEEILPYAQVVRPTGEEQWMILFNGYKHPAGSIIQSDPKRPVLLFRFPIATPETVLVLDPCTEPNVTYCYDVAMGKP